jgi:hypothetical protein
MLHWEWLVVSVGNYFEKGSFFPGFTAFVELFPQATGLVFLIDLKDRKSCSSFSRELWGFWGRVFTEAVVSG